MPVLEQFDGTRNFRMAVRRIANAIYAVSNYNLRKVQRVEVFVKGHRFSIALGLSAPFVNSLTLKPIN